MRVKPNIFATLALIFLLTTGLKAQDLSTRLSQPANYQPKAMTTLQQLIEVAQHYRIPMGIEWVQDPKAETVSLSATNKAATANALIKAILQNAPGYVARQRD